MFPATLYDYYKDIFKIIFRTFADAIFELELLLVVFFLTIAYIDGLC
jgi:hypothetical protein